MDTTEGRKAEPAADRVYDHVKRAILGREYAGGALLTEGEIAEAVGVSRTPVREALLRLQAEELLRLYPKKGALVLAMSAREAEDVFEAREVVESFAAGRAWTHRAALVPVLDSLLARMCDHRDAGDARELTAADRAFHAAVVDAAGNAVLARFYESLRDRQTCIGIASVHSASERMDRVVAAHKEILDALRGDDPDRFRALVRDHVSSSAEHLRRDR